MATHRASGGGNVGPRVGMLAKDFRAQLVMAMALCLLAALVSPWFYIFPALIVVIAVTARVSTVNRYHRGE